MSWNVGAVKAREPRRKGNYTGKIRYGVEEVLETEAGPHSRKASHVLGPASVSVSVGKCE
jgi:hypothetical protein